LTLDKALTKIIVKDAGVATPDHAVVYERADIQNIKLPYPLFVKPLAEGTGKGIDPESVIEGPEQLEKKCAELLERYLQPVLVETYLSGREFTVGIVGTGDKARCIGVIEIILKANGILLCEQGRV